MINNLSLLKLSTSKRDTQSQRSLTIRLKTHRPTLKRS
nr:MAG TPA: hypothetical protein [Caudoviricetes sp.]